MKRLFAILLVVAMCLTLLAGCGSSGNTSSGDDVVSPDPVHSASEPVESPESEDPEPVQSKEAEGSAEPEESSEPEEETYTFEGPGIFEDVTDVPDAYKEAAAQQGTVEQVTYHNGTEEKYFLIYLPYGYETGTERYNVLYVSHGGGGGKPETFLKTDSATALQCTIDNLIQNGEIEPFILVAPTWKTTDFSVDASYGDSSAMVLNFVQNELTQYVVATVDANYRTNATREGRAFGGFSMGGVTTWYTFMYNMECFKYFIPMSGDCWAVAQTGGKTKPAETVAALENAVIEQGYTAEDFVVYVFTGGGDYALPNLAPQIYAMQDSDMFEFGTNAFFGLHPTAIHGDPMARIYLYYILPTLWGE